MKSMKIDKSRIIEQVVEFLDSDMPQKDISDFLSDELDAIQNTFTKSINHNMLKADKEWFLKVSFPCLIKSSNQLLIAVSLNKETENNSSSLNLQDGTILRTDCCDLIQEIKLEAIEVEELIKSEDSKANKVLKMFGYETKKVFPTNPADAFLFDKIFSCIEEYVTNNNMDTEKSDIIDTVRNIDNNCISKYFNNFPINSIYNIPYNAETLCHADIQHCKNHMIAICKIVLEEIKTHKE